MAHVLWREQRIPGRVEDVFPFFESPHNLEQITPPWMSFRVVDSTDETVREGTEISYRLRWLVFPMRWKSRISHYDQNRAFADEMLIGPYRRWYHEHTFHQDGDEVVMTDRVEYELPFGPLGELAHRLIVRRQLEAIFDFRRSAIESLMGSMAQRPSR